jgi:hypothetical protein
VILSADVRRFLRVGVKVALAMQLAFTERPAPPIGQLWVCAKFAVFPLAMVMPEMIRFDPLYLKRPLLYVMLITVGRVVLQVSNADKFVAEYPVSLGKTSKKSFGVSPSERASRVRSFHYDWVRPQSETQPLSQRDYRQNQLPVTIRQTQAAAQAAFCLLSCC